jgi:hypothetical protein
MHEEWADKYDLLEMHHGYIQWIFPVFENAGMNFDSTPLSKAVAALIRANAEASRRVIASYRMMLGFYGFRLADERTGAVERAENHVERLNNLNYSAHNWLRVSRIITSLGELGFQRERPHHRPSSAPPCVATCQGATTTDSLTAAFLSLPHVAGYKAPLLAALKKEIDSGLIANAARSYQDFWIRLLDEDSEWCRPSRARSSRPPLARSLDPRLSSTVSKSPRQAPPLLTPRRVR